MSGRSSAPNADARSVSAITSPAQVELTDALALPALAAYDAASHANAPCEIAFDAASLRLPVRKCRRDGVLHSHPGGRRCQDALGTRCASGR
jgi:hypothetical protein